MFHLSHSCSQSGLNFVSISYFPGSIRNLKGFLLTLEGKSFDTFGVFICIIIELTQLKEDQISALLNVSIVGNVRHDHVLTGNKFIQSGTA